MLKKRDPEKVIEDLRKELLNKWDYKKWFLFFKYVKVGIK